jgi:hypothetical protein
MWVKGKRSGKSRVEQPPTTCILGHFVVSFTLRVKGRQQSEAA